MMMCKFSHLIFQNCQEATTVHIEVKSFFFFFFNLKCCFGAAYWQPKPTEKCCSLKFLEPELRLEGAREILCWGGGWRAGGSKALGTRHTYTLTLAPALTSSVAFEQVT